MKISLIGFMGSGKTTVGRILAEKLEYNFFEIDENIIKHLGRTSMIEVFEKDGEPVMRDVESAEIIKIENFNNLVISTGGGAIQRKESVESLKRNYGKIIYLKTSFETLEHRIKVSKVQDRPMFNNPEKARELYKQRALLYQEIADIQVETDNLTIEQVVEKILQNIV